MVNSTQTSKWWKPWLMPSRVIPVLTILGAGVANILSLLGILPLNQADSIIMALLALIAIDSLTERIGTLEKIEVRLQQLTTTDNLRLRSNIPKPGEMAASASEICILGVTAHYVIAQFTGFYESKLNQGCKMRVIILNPNSVSLQTWNVLRGRNIAKNQIDTTLVVLSDLMKRVHSPDQLQVHLSDVLMPFSMFASDIHKASGQMIVEYYGYKTNEDERGHLQFQASSNPYWFDYYKNQFDQLWNETIDWKSQQASNSP